MKNVIFAAVILSLLTVACSKREPVIDTAQELKLKYDTTAIDSFSPGATSIDIARKISGFFKRGIKIATGREKNYARA